MAASIRSFFVVPTILIFLNACQPTIGVTPVTASSAALEAQLIKAYASAFEECAGYGLAPSTPGGKQCADDKVKLKYQNNKIPSQNNVTGTSPQLNQENPRIVYDHQTNKWHIQSNFTKNQTENNLVSSSKRAARVSWEPKLEECTKEYSAQECFCMIDVFIENDIPIEELLQYTLGFEPRLAGKIDPAFYLVKKRCGIGAH